MKIPTPLKTIKVIPYGWKLLLFDDRELFNQYVKATHPTTHHNHCVSDAGGPQARTVTNRPAAIAIVGLFGNAAGECAAPGTIAHEMLHVVLTIFDHIGLPVNDETSEAACYLVQHLVDEAWPDITRNYTITLNKRRKGK